MTLRTKRRIRFVLTGIVLTLTAAVLTGIRYEQIGQAEDKKRLPQIGHSVDIGGRSLNIHCLGEGNPSVILDAGANTPGYAWLLVQPKIAQFTHVCWYDRAGDGWSDPGPFPRTSAAIAKDLHVLLKAAAIPPPYVLVGHSFGGTNMRVYNGLYPTEMAGMVLVDAWHEDEVTRLPRHKGPGPPEFLRPVVNALTPAFTTIGFVRLFRTPARNSRPPKGLTSEQWSLIQALRRQPKAFAAESSSGLTSEQSGEQARKALGLDDRPLIVLTAGKLEVNSADPVIAREAAEDQEIWMHELQAQLVKLSKRGRQVIVTNSTHGIPYEAPDAVADAVRDVVTTVRQEKQN